MDRAIVDWERQKKALRDPQQILGPTFEEAGIGSAAAKFRLTGEFCHLLERLKVVLLVSREYENLLVALTVEGGRLRQTFLPLPHPSGIAVDRAGQRVFVAATRNPNYLVELRPVRQQQEAPWLTPSRTKVYPGHYYFHDLVFGQGQLWANSVGQNGVVRVDFEQPEPEKIHWWPRCVERNGRPVTDLNYLQLNSIALGPSWEDSFLTASSARISRRRPWHLNYPVDGRGVLFSAATGEVVGKGLTRPHSARFYSGKVWVNNSGYGQLGYFEGPSYRPQWSLGSWTRGLAFHPEGVAWVGLSRVLPGYSHYAPGLTDDRQRCGVVALCLQTMKQLGSITWPAGNQIFAIEWIDREMARGFAYGQIGASQKKHREMHYRYQVAK